MQYLIILSGILWRGNNTYIVQGNPGKNEEDTVYMHILLWEMSFQQFGKHGTNVLTYKAVICQILLSTWFLISDQAF